MELIPAKCPCCSANIDLDATKEQVYCMYCGTKILVKEAVMELKVELKNKVKIDEDEKKLNFEFLAEDAYNNKLYAEARGYYSKVIEIDRNNINARVKRAFCTLMVKGISKENIIQLMNDVNDILKNIESKKDKMPIITSTYSLICKSAKSIKYSVSNNYNKYLTDSTLNQYIETYCTMIKLQSSFLKKYVEVDLYDKYVELIKSLISECDVLDKREYKIKYTVNSNGNYITKYKKININKVKIYETKNQLLTAISIAYPRCTMDLIEKYGIDRSIELAKLPEQELEEFKAVELKKEQEKREYLSRKSKTTAIILGIFLGGFGAHNFYLGYLTQAIIQVSISSVCLLASCFAYGIPLVVNFGIYIWAIVEVVLILTGDINADRSGKELRK